MSLKSAGRAGTLVPQRSPTFLFDGSSFVNPD